MRTIALVLASAVLTIWPGCAVADPFTVNDLLNVESFGQAVLSPDGGTLAFDHLAPAAEREVHQYDYLDRMVGARVMLARGSDEARPLLEESEGRGHVLGEWSPGGERLLIYRLKDRRLSAGLAKAETGEVVWLPGTPEMALWGRAAQWRGPDELIMLMRADEDLPALLRMGWQAGEGLQSAWERTQHGLEPSRTILGGGAFTDLNPQSKPRRVVKVSLPTGEVSTLAEGHFDDMEMSPDGRYLALAGFSQTKTFDPAKPFLQGEIDRRRTLTILDIDKGEVWEPPIAADLGAHLLSWSPCGRRLLTWRREAQQTAGEARLVRITPSERRVEDLPLHGLQPVLVKTGLRMDVAVADWLDGAPVFYARSASGRADWHLLRPDGFRSLSDGMPEPSARLLAVSPGGLLVQAQGGVWRLKADRPPLRLGDVAATALPAFERLFWRGERFQYNSAPRTAWWPIAREGVRRRVQISDGRGFGAVLPEGTLASFTENAAAMRQTDNRHREALLLDGRQVARLNPRFETIDFIEPSPVDYEDKSGRTIRAWLYRPASNLKAEPPPLIVVPYPGSEPSPDRPAEGQTPANVQLMVAQGYAVLIPNLARPDHRGEPAKDMAEDILLAVGAAAASGGFDPDKLIVWGHSFGAYAAMAAAAQSDRFAAVIAANGPYDLISAWGQFGLAAGVAPEDGAPVRARAGWVETGQGGMGGPPWSDPERYIRNSPFLAADRVSAPVMLITGDRDYVPHAQAEEMFSALYRQQKDVVLLTYRGEGHVLSSPANIVDMYDTIWSWLRQVVPGG